jgi:hypothetical protein
VDARQRRFAAVGKAAAAYERGTELNEGLAQYVERRAAGTPIVLDSTDPGATDVRRRAYAVGAALGAVLDRVRPEWRDMLERAPGTATPPLDSLLASALSSATGEGAGCAPSAAARARWANQAADDVRALSAERARTRAEYLGRPGWRIVVEAGDGPFFPQGFDPLNVSRVSPTEILHSRLLELRGPLGAIEVLGTSALTEGVAGRHPLFAGVRRVTITGLATAPSMTDSADVVVVAAHGVTLRLHAARADIVGETIRFTPR